MLKEPSCNKRKCKWFLGVQQPDGTEENEHVFCVAYPEGIPDDIAYGDDLHMEVREDQSNTIVFEKED